MYTVPVRTSQNVVIRYPVAGVGDRIIAYVIDRVILIIYLVAVALLFAQVKVQQPWIWILALAGPFLLFSLLFEIFMNGQTPGKRLLNIQVVRLDGGRASIGDYVLRWVFAIVDVGVMGGAIAVIMVAAGGKGQRLGDLAAGTTVILLVRRAEISSEEIFITADDTYVPVYPEAIQLTARDIELMHRVLEVDEKLDNPEPLELLTEKIKSQLGIHSTMAFAVFLRTLIKDHSHLAAKGAGPP
jgi:uncharacterized RDD family membrane protein YckC